MADSTIAPPTVPRSEAACSGLLATAKFANTAPINSAKNMQLASQDESPQDFTQRWVVSGISYST
jgi:hypothetical protein